MYIDIVIVNWNSGNQAFDCVNSIIANHLSVVSRIIIVDNNSSDGSENKVSNIPKVKLVRSNSNLGFSKACNLGATYTNSDFILFLNPDTRLFSNSFDGILDFMKYNENVGILGIQLFDNDNEVARSCSRFPSSLRFFSMALGLNLIFPSLGMPMREWDHMTSRKVDQVIGAFFLIRKELFAQLKGFDERFFVYFEEVDLSFRAKKIGWDSYFYSEVGAFHEGGGVSKQVKGLRLFYRLRSSLQYAKKNFTLYQSIVTFIIITIIEPSTRIFRGILKLSLSTLKDTFKAFFLLYKWLLKNNI
jgi:GT2 family glycosyltransferase